MVYFLVNNDFHLYDVKKIASELGYENCSLISVPYRMQIPDDMPFVRSYVYKRCEFLFRQGVTKLKQLFCVHKDNIAKRKQISNLKFNKNDILFVFTECELMNMFIIDKMYRSGGKIYLLEDGIAPYVYYTKCSDTPPRRWKLLKYLYTVLYGIKGFLPYFSGTYMYAMMSDKYFSGACLKWDVTLKRNIKCILLKNMEDNHLVESDKQSVFFLTQPIMQGNPEVRKKINQKCIEYCLQNFKHVYVKCHPEEIVSGYYNEIIALCNEYEHVEYVNSTEVAENLIDYYNVGFAASLYSSTLNKLALKGIEPIYMYQFFSELKGLQGLLDDYLKSINYNFILDYRQIGPNYKSGLIKDINSGVVITSLL